MMCLWGDTAGTLAGTVFGSKGTSRGIQTKKARTVSGSSLFCYWLREEDLNLRPSGYENEEYVLPDFLLSYLQYIVVDLQTYL